MAPSLNLGFAGAEPLAHKIYSKSARGATAAPYDLLYEKCCQSTSAFYLEWVAQFIDWLLGTVGCLSEGVTLSGAIGASLNTDSPRRPINCTTTCHGVSHMALLLRLLRFDLWA
jgi:hypothetical protein